jgi:glycosyltransferase involved in cell wall biosynthesis
MKILYITTIPTPYTSALFNHLGKYCDLTVLYELNKAKNRDISWANTNELITYQRHFLKGIRINASTAFNPSVIYWLKQPYDVIVTAYASLTGMLTFEFLRLKRKNNFVFKADGGFIKKDNKIKFAIKKHFIGNAPYYLSSGKTTTKYLTHYGANISKIVEYPFTSCFKKDIQKTVLTNEQKKTLKKHLKIDEQIMVLGVGQLIHRKGFDILIKAAKNISRNVGIYIVGGEPPRKYINLIEKLRLTNIHCLPFKTGIELINLYQAADIFVLPTREDIWGLVINEAMTYGIPVITTNRCIAGLELISNNVEGFIVEADNIQELSDKINFLVDNQEKRIEMGNNALIKIKNYTMENVVKKHIEVFNLVINTNKNV